MILDCWFNVALTIVPVNGLSQRCRTMVINLDPAPAPPQKSLLAQVIQWSWTFFLLS